LLDFSLNNLYCEKMKVIPVLQTNFMVLLVGKKKY